MRDRGACEGLLFAVLVVLSGRLLGIVPDFTPARAGDELRDFVADFADINFNIFCKEAFLVASCVAPLYAGARLIDNRVHHTLYDESCHKNTCDIGCLRSCLVEDVGIAVPILALSFGFWISDDDRTHFVGRDLLAGMIAIGFAKNILKECLAVSCCYRPYSGCFPKKLALGGFPSGHAAALCFVTTLLALDKGARWAVPVGMYSTVVLGSLLACNYHYVSQLVAGAGLGALFAVAAHRVVNERMNERASLEFYTDQYGKPMVGFSYSF